jgi:hypothetical protein
VVIYDRNGLFEPSGIVSLQILPTPPELADEPWLVPVGQAYFVRPEDRPGSERAIAFNYLQRDVPEGYEHTLAVYYLQAEDTTWRRLDSRQFVENMVVADLQTEAGTYAVISTVALPELQPGWNLLAYPLPDSRPVSEALLSVIDRVAEVIEPTVDPAYLAALATKTQPPGTAEWVTARVNLRIRQGPGEEFPAVSFLRGGESLPLLATDRDTGWLQIECPAEIEGTSDCWVSGYPEYTHVTVKEHTQTSEFESLLSGPSTVPEALEFGHVYLIGIEGTESVMPFLAPPLRTPDGVVPGSR